MDEKKSGRCCSTTGYRMSHQMRNLADRPLGHTVSDVDHNADARNDIVSVSTVCH